MSENKNARPEDPVSTMVMPGSQTDSRRGRPQASMDMTTGSPYQLIMRFAMPLLLGNILQQLYNMVDSMVVGQYVGKQALAAVGTSFPIIFLINSLFMGIGTGATIIVSQYFGARDLASVRRSVDTIYIALMAVSIPVTILGVLISEPVLLLINTPADTLPQATTYMRIIFLGTAASFGYNINSGILQGLGDSRTPLLFLGIATGINIVLDLLFVLAFGWGVAGVAYATIIAQLCSFVFGLVYLSRRSHVLQVRLKGHQFDSRILMDSLRIGLPSGLQFVVFSLGSIALQGLINGYGSDFMAGFNGANKIDAFAFLPIASFASAVTTFVGQNVGANRLDRVKTGVRATLILSAGVCILTCTSLVLAAGPLMRLFSAESAVIEAGKAYLYRIVPFYILLSVLFILNGFLRGTGNALIPFLATTASLWLARVPVAYLFADRFGRDSLYFSYAIGWAFGLMIVIPYILSGRWRANALLRTAASRVVD